MTFITNAILRIYELGGPVVVILLFVSIITLAIILYKIWQFTVSGVGRHKSLNLALNAWDKGDRAQAATLLNQSSSYLAPLVDMAFDARRKLSSDRLEAEAETRF